MAYDAKSDTFASYFNEKLPRPLPRHRGRVRLGLRGGPDERQDLTGALKIAVDYTLESIRATMADPKANWYGVNFETAIPMLVHSLGR